MAADTEANIIYVLMGDGEVKVYDAAMPMGGGGGGGGGGAGSLWGCQVITHDPSPRSLGTETRGEYRRWRERVGLDDRSGSGKLSANAASRGSFSRSSHGALLESHAAVPGATSP